jgi:hypothetical protein
LNLQNYGLELFASTPADNDMITSTREFSRYGSTDAGNCTHAHN